MRETTGGTADFAACSCTLLKWDTYENEIRLNSLWNKISMFFFLLATADKMLNHFKYSDEYIFFMLAYFFYFGFNNILYHIRESQAIISEAWPTGKP